MTSIRRAWLPALLLAAIAGCNDQSAPVDATATASAPSSAVAPGGDPAPPAEAAAVSLSEEQVAAIKELPAAEQPLALKQAVCPVSGGKLGAMGMPMKITAKGQTFYLCCDGCEGKVETDPDTVLAKLKK